jgi:hypothetical protein
MKNMTVKELRERARELAIPGYSKMRKDELLAAIAKDGTAKPTETKPEAAAPAPEATPTEATEREQHIERMKYATGAAEHVYSPDLGEDIDQLPPLRGEPRIALLAQKPGVLYAYWHLNPGQLESQPGLRLRLGLLYEHEFHAKEEVTLTSDRGSWYFHVDESWHPASIYVQLGRYTDDGQFEIAIRRGIVHLPRLLEYSSLGINWGLTREEFERARVSAGTLGLAAPGHWPRGPSSYDVVSSHVVSSDASGRRG